MYSDDKFFLTFLDAPFKIEEHTIKHYVNQTRVKILDKLKEYPIVIGYHDLMIHDYGPGTAFCSIHFETDKNHDPLYVHELIDKFEREFLSLGVSLTVHYDPVVTDSEEIKAVVSAAGGRTVKERAADTHLPLSFQNIISLFNPAAQPYVPPFLQPWLLWQPSFPSLLLLFES